MSMYRQLICATLSNNLDINLPFSSDVDIADWNQHDIFIVQSTNNDVQKYSEPKGERPSHYYLKTVEI